MEIALAIDTYDDIFSDFDIRGFEDRALSKDFLDELQLRLRRTRKKTDLKIVFQIPAACRDSVSEKLIIERLRRFYVERKDHYIRENRRAAVKAAVYVAIGLLLIAAANVFVKYFADFPLFSDFLLIPSWFFVWSGFDLLEKRGEVGRKKRYYEALGRSVTAFEYIDG